MHYQQHQPVAYTKDAMPQELLIEYPHCALHRCIINSVTYEVYLCCSSLKDITGKPAEHIINLKEMDLTDEQLEEMVKGLLTGEQSNSEVHLTPGQYHSLHRNLFKPIEQGN